MASTPLYPVMIVRDYATFDIIWQQINTVDHFKNLVALKSSNFGVKLHCKHNMPFMAIDVRVNQMSLGYIK